MRWLVALLLLHLCRSFVQATSLVLSEVPAAAEADSPFEVLVDFVTSSKNATYYLAGRFYKTKGSNLFGFTEVDGEWVPASASPSSFFPITTSEEGSWSGKLQVKADSDDTGFDGEGMYFLRIDRFTGKSDNPAESSNAVEIRLKYQPPATPTPTPQPAPEATAGEATPTPTPRSTPTPIPTPKPSPIATVSPSVKPKPTSLIEASRSAVMGIADIAATPASAVAEAVEAIPTESDKTAPTTILIGSLLLTGGVISLALKLFPRLE